MINILFLGDIVGKPGRRALEQRLPDIKQTYAIDMVIANVENVAGGSGITKECFDDLASIGVQVMTTGDHIYKNKDYVRVIHQKTLVRPANLSVYAEGQGYTIVDINGTSVCVINLLGRIFMGPSDCPFHACDTILKETEEKAQVHIVDMHAEATSEKVAMGWFLDGRVSAVIGSHTHIQTSDARILPKGTAYLTDGGMVGSRYGVLGRKVKPVLYKFTTNMPARFDVASEDCVIEGAVISVDPVTGKAQNIEAIRITEK